MTHAINGEIIPALSGWQALGFIAATFAIVTIVKLLRRRSRTMRCLVLSLALVAIPSASALAQSWTVPAAAERCPSKWGADDTREIGRASCRERVL